MRLTTRLKRGVLRCCGPFVYSLARIYWFIFRPESEGAKCLVECHGKFLLVKLAYSHKSWTLPGGGLNKGETPESAARREVFEETSVILSDLTHIGEFQSTKEFKKDTVYCYHGMSNNSEISIDNLEISEAGWFSRDNLPTHYMPVIDYLFEMYDKRINTK